MGSDHISLIKQRCRISDYIGKYTALKIRSAGEFIGLCPFHNEKTPSFTVSENKEFFYCFGCKEGGDVFSFVMKKYGIGYGDAVKKLAGEFGVQLRSDSLLLSREKKDNEEIGAVIANFYHENLMKNRSSEAFRYLQQRGLNQDVIEKHRIGYAGGDMRAFFRSLVERFGLNFIIKNKWFNLKKRESAAQHDLSNPFYGRIIFPIFNGRGVVVGFGGRALSNNEGTVKYINSADSAVFHKSEVFYGMHNIVRAKDAPVVLVEGYFDVITLAAAGMLNVLAPLGTNIKIGQIEKLWKYADYPIICFDGDEAGQNAMMRIAKMVLPHLTPGKGVRFVILPNGDDPDSAQRRDGSFVQKLQNDAISIVDFIFIKVVNGRERGSMSPDDKAKMRNLLKSCALAIKHKELSYEYKVAFEERYWAWIKSGRNSTKKFGALSEFVDVRRNKSKNLLLLTSVLIKYRALLDDDDICDEMSRLSEAKNEFFMRLNSYITDCSDFMHEDDRVLFKEAEKIKVVDGIDVGKALVMRILIAMRVEELTSEIAAISKEMMNTSADISHQELARMEKQLMHLKQEEAQMKKSLLLLQ